MQRVKSLLLFTALSTVFVLLTGSNNFNYDYKLSNSLKLMLVDASENETVLVWVELTDKGEGSDQLLAAPENILTERSLQRRMKVYSPDRLADKTDLPLNESYVSEVVSTGVSVKQRSKWFNRISCYATRDQISELSALECVKALEPVRKFRKNIEHPETPEGPVVSDSNSEINLETDALNYGSSLAQMQIINAVTTHDSGYFGQNVIIALLDAGVDNIEHNCFDSLRARGYRSYDFVNNDTIVDDQSGQQGQGWHGTMTLSLVGGYRPGSLISPAFRSKYFLAKTENTNSETPVEEDNWIAAAEWADSLGADIITSSLGYIGMDPGSTRSYNWTWMNGDSCVITIGADLAVNKGMVVCNSAGNEGTNASHNTLGAPSDGDSVIAVGSVTSTGSRSSFSSVGLTTDGRIKPDVMARGSGNYVAQTGSGNGYTSGNGTSFSCPMTAGVVAQMLSANNSLTPIQVREILKQTASRSTTPDRFMGWGIINSWEAVKLARNTVNPKTLNLKLYIEGLYNAGSMMMTQDTVSVYLRNPASPYQIVDVSSQVLNTAGSGVFTFLNAPSSTYYIQVSHRSAIDTWSKLPLTFVSGNLSYDFTTDSSKAYGNNMTVSGSKWLFFTGDLNQDNSVDGSDLSVIDNLASSFATGYMSADLDGNGIIDGSDYALCDNNTTNLITTISP